MKSYLPEICGYGLSFTADGFRIVFAAVTVFAWLMSLALSRQYMKGEEHRGRYYFFTAVTLGAKIGRAHV